MAKINLEGMGEAGIRCDVAGSGSICDILLAGSGVPACASGRFHMITYHDSMYFILCLNYACTIICTIISDLTLYKVPYYYYY